MKIPYHNDTKNPAHIGPVTIMPGATRDVEESHIPGYKAKEATVVKAPPNPLAELLKGNVKDVTAGLKDLSVEDLEKLGDLEQTGQNRKGVLSAVAELLLNRAAQADMLDKVAKLTDEELAAALEDAKTDINVDADYLAALEAEAAKRNPAAAE